MSAALIDALRAALGEAHVLLPAEHDLSGYERDWCKRYVGRALAVVRPADTAQVAAVVTLAREHGVALVPQGGNTGLVGGGVPDDSGAQLLLSLQRLNRVRQIDPSNLTMTVEAGCVLQNVQRAAREAGWLFPLSLAAEGSCTIGGNAICAWAWRS
jgi:FAD/FMN-containing dehydrogenase